MEASVYAELIWITAALMGSLGAVVFFGSRNLSSRAFARSVFLVAAWIASVGLFVAARDYSIAIFYSRTTFLLGCIIAINFFYFFLVYPEDIRPPKIVSVTLITFSIILIYPFLFTNKVISGLFQIQAVHPWGWEFGPMSFMFETVFFGLFAWGIYILYKKAKRQTELAARRNLILMVWAIIIGLIPASLICIILPRLGSFYFNWLGPIGEIMWIPAIAYLIIKYRQMNVRAVMTEALAIAMSVIFFINIFLDAPMGIWDNIIEFIVFLVLAIYLIRGVLREAQQRDQLDDLNHNLETRVAAQTVEIKKAYESEKRSRLELEKLNDAKDQFIMISQHHLRTPVSSMLRAVEAPLKGTCGTVSPRLQSVLKEIKTSGNRLMHLVDDFLNITAIRVGSNILNQKNVSLKSAIGEVLAELDGPIKEMNVRVRCPHDMNHWPTLFIDYDKIRECLFVVIENAIRYNHLEGLISITTAIENNLFKIIIDNTGLGISKEESNKIGSALFYRGEYARKAYPIGMGVGLSTVKAIIHAHHGTFTIESDGENLGARVTIGLPHYAANKQVALGLNP